MRTRPRIDEYQRRRQRLARRRRNGCRPWLKRPTFLPSPAPTPGNLDNGIDDDLRDALRELIRRACSHRAVMGLLLLCRGEQVVVRIVAQRPMTSPVRMLADAWWAELDEAHPGIAWSLEVSAAPPAPEQHYQCLYWCAH